MIERPHDSHAIDLAATCPVRYKGDWAVNAAGFAWAPIRAADDRRDTAWIRGSIRRMTGAARRD